MDELKKLYRDACKAYNKSKPHFQKCRAVVQHCQQKLNDDAKLGEYGKFAGTPDIQYSAFTSGQAISRPVHPDFFTATNNDFEVNLETVLKIAKDPERKWTDSERKLSSQTIYTAIMSFACCYDLWNPKARKTPGTFFEVFMAGLLQSVFTDIAFSKHIPLTKILDAGGSPPNAEDNPDQDEAISDGNEGDEKSSVATDVVLSAPNKKGGIVLPLKITTRERVVQPFAHQRILDAAFEPGTYKSLIVCISETQLDKEAKKVKQICVPGTIQLFQKYLAPIEGIYYCDVPQRYAKNDVTDVIKVKSIGHLFCDLRQQLAQLKEQA